MSPTPSRPDPANDANPNHASPTPLSPNLLSQRDEDAQYYRGILHELVEMATDIARAVHRQATAEQSAEHGPAGAAQPQAPAPDPTIAFDRIARTLRRTIALARKLADPAPLSTAAQAAERRRIARKQIIRAVEDSIQRDADSAEADALHAELYERLDTIDLDDDIDTLPIAEIIAAIRRDLGIAAMPGAHPWKRRTPQDVRDLCARAAQPRTPQPRTTQPGTGDPRPVPAPPPRPRPGTGPPGP